MSYDLVVIGGGAAGMSAARTARRRRARVALVQHGPVGGDCTFVGCVPSKTMIESAAAGRDFETAMRRVRQAVGRIAATETAAVLRGEGIEVIDGAGRLLAAGRVGAARAAADRAAAGRAGAIRVGAAGTEVRARQLIVATGTSPMIPPVPGLADLDVLTNETVFDLPERPASLIVMGGGPIGVELAQAFARLGTSVTVVEAAGRLLAREEPEVSEVVADALAADGVKVVTGRGVAAAEVAADGCRIRLHDGSDIAAARILAAVGRRPVTDGLDLGAAGVAVDEAGFVRTDDHLRTNVGGIWAAGDITGRLQLTHAADDMGRIAANNALSRVPYRRFRAEHIPTVTFTDPEIARVGMTEADAAGAVDGARVAYLPMSQVDRAIAAGRTEGFVKLVVGPRRATGDLAGGRLLGATMVAPRAGEMIHEATLVMRARIFPALLALTTHAYPTWSVAVRQAATQLFFAVDGRQARPARP